MDLVASYNHFEMSDQRAALVSILHGTSILNSAASSNVMQSSNLFYPRVSLFITCHDLVVHDFRGQKKS